MYDKNVLANSDTFLFILQMEYNTLGNTDLKVSRVCVGTWQFNDGQQSADKTWNAQACEVT